MKKIVISSLLLIFLFLSACENRHNDITEPPKDTNSSPVETNTTPVDTSAPEKSETKESPTVESTLIAFVDAFNSSSETDLEFVEDFTPSDTSSSHYRTEFRLGAYADAVGKSYAYGDTIVDLVGIEQMFTGITFRVYMDGATLDQCVEMFKIYTPFMNKEITAEEIQESVDYLMENQMANGYYCADIGVLMLGSDSNGYDLMLKQD